MSSSVCLDSFDSGWSDGSNSQESRQYLRLVSSAKSWSPETIGDSELNWFAEVDQRLSLLSRLNRGWDGYDGRPVSNQVVAFTRQMLKELYLDGLPMPALVPGSDGSLQVEWHQNGLDIELDVLGPHDVVAFKAVRHDSNRDEELNITNDFSSVAQWVQYLS